MVNGPYDFYYSNYLSLQTALDMVKYVMFPESRPAQQRCVLTEDDLCFVRRYMGLYPAESGISEYGSDTLLCDNFKKYFIHGDRYGYAEKITDTTLRIFNIVGRAEGYLSDVAYIADFDHGIEFMLAAVIYVNRSNVMRDNRNEYYGEGLPFLGRLGRAFYRFEKKRPRANRPDLDNFRRCVDGRSDPR